MANKWRILHKAIETNPDTAEKIVKAVCILHNVIIDKERIPVNEFMDYEDPLPRNPATRDNHAPQNAVVVREMFKDYFLNKR